MDYPNHCDTYEISDYEYQSRSEKGKWLFSTLLQNGDYTDSVIRSNARVFERDFADGEDVWWRWSRGSIAIRTLAYRNATVVREWLDALDSYCLADDEDHSELEREDQQENWDSWGRSDFRRELIRVVKTHFSILEVEKDQNDRDANDVIDLLSDEQIDALFWGLCRQEDKYPEGSNDVSFPLVDLADAWAGDSDRAGSWYHEIIPCGMVPGFDENGKVLRQDGEGWYMPFALPVRCNRCDDEKIVGECHEHTDCLADRDLGRACPDALKQLECAWAQDCKDPNCDAVHSAREILHARKLLQPGTQQELFT